MTDASARRDLMTVREAAGRLGCSIRTVQRMIVRNELPAEGRMWLPDGPYLIDATLVEEAARRYAHRWRSRV